MRLRFKLSLGGLLLVLVAGALATRRAAPPSQGTGIPVSRYNVILVVVDALRADYVGTYGFQGPITPSLDSFARSAIVYEHAYSPAPWTLPSTASLFTGLDAPGHGVGTSATERWTTDALPLSSDTLAEAFSRSGYRTGAFIANDWLKDRGFDQGFDQASIGGEVLWSGSNLSGLFLEWLSLEPSPRPFFGYLHYMDVHAPYRVDWEDFKAMRASATVLPDAPIDKERLHWIRENEGAMTRWPQAGMEERVSNWRAAYASGVRRLDRVLGELLQQLEERGLYENTIVIVTSDHGEELFDHGDIGHGVTLFDEVLRVPLLLRLPGKERTGRRLEQAVSLIDLKPWLAEVCGLSGSASPGGRPLPLDAAPFRLMDWLGSARRTLHASAVSENPAAFSVFDGRFRLIMDSGARPVRLFDHQTDPQEHRDVASREPWAVRRLFLEGAREQRDLTGLRDQVRHPGPPLDTQAVERLRSLGYAR